MFEGSKKKWKMIVEIADSILTKGKYVQLAALFSSFCVNSNLYLIERHINFINTKNGVEIPCHGQNHDFLSKTNTHSNCHQLLVFSKLRSKFNFKGGKFYYSNYQKTKTHPCPFPKNHFFIFDLYFRKGILSL